MGLNDRKQQHDLCQLWQPLFLSEFAVVTQSIPLMIVGNMNAKAAEQELKKRRLRVEVITERRSGFEGKACSKKIRAKE